LVKIIVVRYIKDFRLKFKSDFFYGSKVARGVKLNARSPNSAGLKTHGIFPTFSTCLRDLKLQDDMCTFTQYSE